MTEAPALIHLTSPDGRLSAWIAPDQGAELCGLEWQGRELLYRGLDFSPTTGWTGRAPVLWPAIGRTFAAGPEPTVETFKQAPLGWKVDGIDYPMAMHGFARSLPWRVEHQTSTTLRLVLEDSPESRACYPFGFRHGLTYTLTDGLLTLDHEIEAAWDNRSPMPFVLGNHATFRLSPSAAPQESTLVSNTHRRMVLDGAGRPTGHTVEFDRFITPRAVNTIGTFDVIALQSAGEPPWARLTDPSGVSITVALQRADRSRSELEFITLWGDPGGGYLSLEAWLGKPNALASENGVCRLVPDMTDRTTISIRVDTA